MKESAACTCDDESRLFHGAATPPRVERRSAGSCPGPSLKEDATWCHPSTSTRSKPTVRITSLVTAIESLRRAAAPGARCREPLLGVDTPGVQAAMGVRLRRRESLRDRSAGAPFDRGPGESLIRASHHRRTFASTERRALPIKASCGPCGSEPSRLSSCDHAPIPTVHTRPYRPSGQRSSRSLRLYG